MEDPQDLSSLPIAEASQPLSPQHESPNPLFFGRFGLRAGYGIAIWLVFWFIFTVLGSIFAVAASGHARDIMNARTQQQANPHSPRPHVSIPLTPAIPIVSDGIVFAGLFAVCWFFARAERRSLRSYGIGSNRWKDVFPGALWGLVMMSLLIFVLHAAHLLVFDSVALHGAAVPIYGLKWLIAFLLVGFSEEYTFRGYIQFSLMRGVWGLAEKLSDKNTQRNAFWIAATISSVLFACAHIGNGGETFFGLFQVFLAGITFAYALWRSGSLWWAIGYHATWDWAQSFLFGVADSGNVSVGRLFVTHPTGKTWLSGGPDGPEGSIFATVALLLTLVVIHFISFGAQPSVEQLPPTESLPPGKDPLVA